MRTRGPGRGTVILLVLAAFLLGGCTTDGTPPDGPTPTVPTAGDDEEDAQERPRRGAAVVLPPPDATTDEERTRLRTMLEDLEQEVDGLEDLRIVTADGPEFVPDLLELLASEGYALVCALGTSSGEAVVEVAPAFPRTRFCAMPAQVDDPPPNVLAADLRVEEVAFLAGAAAAIRAPDAPAGLIAGENIWALEEQRVGFERGIREVAPEAPPPLVAFPVRDAEEAAAQARAQLGAGASTLYTNAGDADSGVLDAVDAVADERREATPTEGGPSAPLPLAEGSAVTLLPGEDGDEEEAPPARPRVLLTFETRLDTVIAEAARRLADWSGGQISLGLADGALRVDAGPSPVSATVMPRLDGLRRAIVEGRLSVLPPSP